MLWIQFDVECVVSYFMAIWHHIYFCLSSNFVPSIITRSDYYSSLTCLMWKFLKYQLHTKLTESSIQFDVKYVVSYYVAILHPIYFYLSFNFIRSIEILLALLKQGWIFMNSRALLNNLLRLLNFKSLLSNILITIGLPLDIDCLLTGCIFYHCLFTGCIIYWLLIHTLLFYSVVKVSIICNT